ncbi:MAG: glutathione S-transferase N-terminal domain-containing protein [Proteobacteria bacterium]|nr:glutathione S-transferase N-terminal domain-containing protein [Pseudomonadota bacterium]
MIGPNTNELPIFYSFRRCPYAMRARMTLGYAGVACELREVVLRDKPPSLLSYSPKGTVPVLVLGDQVIDESDEVMKWALRQSDPDGWISQASEEVLEEANELVALCENEFKPRLDLDVALMPFIRQFANVDKAWFDSCTYGYLIDWLEKMLSRPLFASVMAKYPLWHEGDPLTLFP